MRRRGRTVAVAALTIIGSIVLSGTPSGATGRSAGRSGSGDQGGSSRRTRPDSGSADGLPARFVAGVDGRIAAVSAETGRVDRYLTAEHLGGGAEEPTVSPDGRTVWFSRGDGSCAAHIASVPTAGGSEKALPGSGEAGPEGTPLPRPGQAQLAWSRTDCQDSAEALVVGDLRGLQGHGQIGLVPLAWSRDGDQLLAVTSDGTEVHLIDVTPSGALDADRVLAPADRTADCRLQVVDFSPDDNGGYLAERRCGPSGEQGRRSLVLLDKDGGVRRAVLRLPRGEEFVDRAAFDRSGHALLYSTSASAGEGISLWLWRDGDSRLLARQSRYRHPSWLP